MPYLKNTKKLETFQNRGSQMRDVQLISYKEQMMKPELLSQKENIHWREDTIVHLEG